MDAIETLKECRSALIGSPVDVELIKKIDACLSETNMVLPTPRTFEQAHFMVHVGMMFLGMDYQLLCTHEPGTIH